VKRLLAPLWYPPEPSFAGGFYRAKRILESLRQWEPYVIASDTFPISGAHVRRYPTALLRANSALIFKVMRALNWGWSAAAIVFLALLRRRRYDLVYAGPSEILPISLSALVIGKLLRIPVVLCNQNVRDTELWALNRAIHQAADVIITVSEALQGELRREGLHGPVFVGTNGVDDFSVPGKPPVYDAVFVGRHTEGKGIFDLFAIWRIVCDTKPGARLACAGFIPPHLENRIRGTLRDLRLEERVALLGPVVEDEKWRLYAVSRICVFPSHVEGWGIVPIEAHLAGLPVVAYALGAYADTIAQSPGATLVPVGDLDAFAEATSAALDATPDSEKLHAWARSFTWRAAADREELLLDRVLQHARQRS